MRYVLTLKELTVDIGSNMLSLLLDEGNNVSAKKLLGASVIYFCRASTKVRSNYLGHAQFEKCDAGSIATAYKNCQ